MSDESKSATGERPPAEQPKNSDKQRRDIPGNFSYTTSPGVLAKALQRIIVSERPPHFTHDFVATVLQCSGGSGRAIVPILKKAGLVGSDGVPTELYAQFQSDSRRPQAALEALRKGWPELFRKNRYAHKLDRAGTDDLFKEITGLTKSDKTFHAIVSTYNALHEYAKNAPETGASENSAPAERDEQADIQIRPGTETRRQAIEFGLTNQINIVLPETTDISVYHAIFKSLRENLLS